MTEAGNIKDQKRGKPKPEQRRSNGVQRKKGPLSDLRKDVTSLWGTREGAQEDLKGFLVEK